MSSCKGHRNRGRVRLPTAFAVTSVASKALVRHLWRKPVLKVLFAVMWPLILKINKHETTDSNSTNVVRLLALEGHQPS